MYFSALKNNNNNNKCSLHFSIGQIMISCRCENMINLKYEYFYK